MMLNNWHKATFARDWAVLKIRYLTCRRHFIQSKKQRETKNAKPMPPKILIERCSSEPPMVVKCGKSPAMLKPRVVKWMKKSAKCASAAPVRHGSATCGPIGWMPPGRFHQENAKSFDDAPGGLAHRHEPRWICGALVAQVCGTVQGHLLGLPLCLGPAWFALRNAGSLSGSSYPWEGCGAPW